MSSYVPTPRRTRPILDRVQWRPAVSLLHVLVKRMEPIGLILSANVPIPR